MEKLVAEFSDFSGVFQELSLPEYFVRVLQGQKDVLKCYKDGHTHHTTVLLFFTVLLCYWHFCTSLLGSVEMGTVEKNTQAEIGL